MDDKTLLDLFASLSWEIKGVKDGLSREITEVKDGILNGGTRQLARLIARSEEVDSIIAERDRRIAELTRRLEGKG